MKRKEKESYSLEEEGGRKVDKRQREEETACKAEGKAEIGE